MLDLKNFLTINRPLLFNAYSIYLLIYFILLLVSSLSVYLTCLVNIIVFCYVFLIPYSSKTNKFKIYLLLSSIGNFITFEVTVASYAELLPWEHILHVLFYIMAFYYFFFSLSNTEQVFDFKMNSYIKRYFSNETDSMLNSFKFILCLFVASAYSTQLTFTTLCTPYMVFDWFLVIKDCSLVYSNYFSSISMACGVSCINTTLSAIPLLISTFKKVINIYKKSRPQIFHLSERLSI